MKKSGLMTIIMLLTIQFFSQQRIDGNFPFQTDPAKKYSLYIPSSYNATAPNKLMLGLHPFNTSRWNGISWCDTLINFAEINNLILVCPDGGLDGKIDDPIDTAFTTALLDSVKTWYNININKTYIMGFSWGGKTTYTYGLNRPNVFNGYLPIGAAISGTSEVTVPLQLNGSNKAVYIIHGGLDSPNSRFYPIRDSLISKGAIVNTNLMAGIGHTIDFPNRDFILSIGYQWIDSVNCYQLSVSTKPNDSPKLENRIFPNPIKQGNPINIELTLKNNFENASVSIFDVYGKRVKNKNVILRNGINQLNITSLPKGIYIFSIKLNHYNTQINKKIIIK